MTTRGIARVLAAATFASALLLVELAYAGPLPGAIFTTDVDGHVVNANIYPAKEDVYLDGGPGPHAPSTAAGLPEGDYFFQVTDPSGKILLSTDHISCRKIHVNAFGVISQVYAGTNYVWTAGSWTPVIFQHAQGVDSDHSELGAITVQLFPYDDTPNKGGVYKVWVTPVERYAGDPGFVPSKHSDPVNGESYQPGNFHGFIPAWSKTDNYKVRKRGGGGGQVDQFLDVLKFHDANVNCALDPSDPNEELVDGWAVDITDGTDVTNTYYTPVHLLVVPGIYTAVENTAGVLQTCSSLDGVLQSCYPTASPTVVVEVTTQTLREVIYGNVGLGQVEACKFYDRDADGVWDVGEPGVSGWKMVLTGTAVTGDTVGPLTQYTGEGGCTTFGNLLPGTYQVEEILAECEPGSLWQATGPTTITSVLGSTVDGGTIAGATLDADFGNVCTGLADFGTKGYWHNKNGLAELTQANIDYVNGLNPYDDPTSYFDGGDEPFDGLFQSGTPVPESKGILGETLAPAGSWQAEVSAFLVDPNAGGDPREQLAQQLLAFIFNVQHRLDGLDAMIQLPAGTFVKASDLILQAINAWQSGTGDEQHALQSLLNELNNSDAVPFLHADPCAVVYP